MNYLVLLFAEEEIEILMRFNDSFTLKLAAKAPKLPLMAPSNRGIVYCISSKIHAMRMPKTSLFVLAFFCFTGALLAQLPSTQIYTIDMKANESKVLLEDISMITAFNPNGYNNQPHFIDNNHLLIASDYKAGDATDIWELDLADKLATRITATASGEYSPTIQADGFHFSVIRQTNANTAENSQILWSYPLDRSSGGKSIVLDPATVGYHCWLSDELLALFLVGDPQELVLYNIKTKSSEHIAYNIGRSLKTDKRGDLYYIQKTGSSGIIRKYDTSLKRSTFVTSTIPGQDDFEILPNGFLISSNGSSLMTFRPHIDQKWQVLKDLSPAGITKISRIAASQNKIAIVVSE